MEFEDRQLFRLIQVLRLLGLSKSTLYQFIQAGYFPRPVRIGRRAVAWRARDVYAWIEARPSVKKKES